MNLLLKHCELRIRRVVFVLAVYFVCSSVSLGQTPPSEGEAFILQAHALSNAAKTEEQLTKVIELCRQASECNLSADLTRYNKTLRSWAHNRRGEARLENGNTDSAATDFEVAVGLAPNSWRALKNRALSYARQHEFERALADLDKVLQLKNECADAYFHRAEVHRELGHFAKASSDYDIYIDVRPDDAEAYAGRGNVLFQLGKHKSGVADLYRALELDPQNASALVYRGEAFTELGIFDKAARDFRAAIEIDTASGRAYRSAAWLMATCPDEKFQNAPLALEAARKAVKLAGKPSFREFDTLAAAEANAGDYDAAKQTLVKAMKLASNTERQILASRLELYQQSKPFRLESKSASDHKIAEGPVVGPAFR